AVLALLFPGLFGGVFLIFRRWFALLTVVSTNCALYFAYLWFSVALRDSWWGRPSSLWTLMTLVTLLGVLWSWRRHSVGIGIANAEQPRRAEMITLLALSLLGVAGTAFVFASPSPIDLPGKLLLVFVVGIVVGTGSIGWLRLRRRTPVLPTEGVVLGAML